MKIGIASEGEFVAEHFGHCSNFNIFQIEDGKIIGKESFDNPGHKPGYLPNFLADLGVNIVVSGGMGKGAIDIFKEKNIEVITGGSGRAEDLVLKYLDGDLKSSQSVCNKHEHSGDCGGH